MTARVPTTLINSLQLAKQGDAEAIAALVNRSLQPQGIRVVAVAVEGERLHLVLESAEAPDQETVVPFIRQSISQLGTEAIRVVVLYGKSQHQSTQAWEQEIVLEVPAKAGTSATNRVISQSGETQRSQEVEETNAPEAGRVATVAELPATWLEPDLENSPRMAIGNKVLHKTSHGGVVNLAPGFRRLVVRSRLVSTPAQGSQPFPNLLDRQLETEEAIAALQAGSSVAFFGETGSGKTALLRSLAHHTELAGAFRDGIVYQRGRFQSASDLLQSLFDAFFDCDSSLPTRPTTDELRQAFQSHRALAVLDDVDLPEAEVAQLHSLPGLVILSASQERQIWNRINAMPMLGLPLNDALTLVERGLGRSLTADERSDAEVLCNLVQGHPLRILQLTALMREEGQTLAVLVQRLRLAPSVDALPIKAAVSLPEAERRVLAVLVVLDGVSVRAEHLAALTGLPNIQTVLATLARRYLVLTDNSRFYLSQPIVAALRPAWNLSQWTQRVITYFYRWLERQSQLDDLVPELEVLLQVLRLAVTTQQPNVVLRLAQQLDPVLLSKGRWSAWEQTWQWALQSGRSLQDPAAMAMALHQLGTRALLVDDPLTAHTYLAEALQLRDALGDRPGSAATRHNLELVLTLPTEFDPVAVAASPPRPLTQSRFPKQAAIVVGSLGMAIAGMLLLLNPFPRPASFSLSATRLGFGEQTLNTSSTSQTVRLTNTGARPLEITSITPSGNSKDDFQVIENCTATPIAPKDDCTIEITFTPQAEGDRLATVLILDRAGDNPQELLLSGIGAPPSSPFVLSFAPGNVTFEPQVLNATSKPQSIMVTNTGSEPVAIARVTITGEQASEFKSTTNCVNLTLEPKQTCRIQVSFTPKTSADRRASVLVTAKGEADLSAAGELPNQPPPFWNIPLGGTGVAPTARNTTNAAPTTSSAPTPIATAPRVSLSLSELHFGAQGIETRAEKPLVIANTGTASLYIDDLTIAGENPRDFAITDNTCLGGPILADDGCIVTVRFSPGAEGERRADLVIRDSTSGSPRRIALSGVGVERSPATPATPSASPPTILNFAATSPQIEAGESVQLCYGVANATKVTIEGIGEVAPATEECVAVEPTQTTTYNLMAIGADEQEVTAQTTVQVVQPNVSPPESEPTAPPTTPQSLSPGSSDRGSAPDLLSCKNSTSLTWQSNGSERDVLTLQQFSQEYQDWMTVFEEPMPSGTDVTPWLTQSQSYEWRWMVRSVDGSGRSSEPSSWYYFTCYDFQ